MRAIFCCILLSLLSISQPVMGAHDADPKTKLSDGKNKPASDANKHVVESPVTVEIHGGGTQAQAEDHEANSKSFIRRTLSDPLAAFTALLSLVTVTLAVLGIIQARQASRGFVLTHRPKLIARLFRFQQHARPGPTAMEFSVTNEGGTSTDIVGSFYGITTDARLTGVPNYSPATIPDSAKKYAAGETKVVTLEIADLPTWVELADENGKFFFFGYLDYRDKLKVVRRVAWGQWYNPKNTQFELTNNYNYEYGN